MYIQNLGSDDFDMFHRDGNSCPTPPSLATTCCSNSGRIDVSCDEGSKCSFFCCAQLASLRVGKKVLKKSYVQCVLIHSWEIQDLGPKICGCFSVSNARLGIADPGLWYLVCSALGRLGSLKRKLQKYKGAVQVLFIADQFQNMRPISIRRQGHFFLRDILQAGCSCAIEEATVWKRGKGEAWSSDWLIWIIAESYGYGTNLRHTGFHIKIVAFVVDVHARKNKRFRLIPRTFCRYGNAMSIHLSTSPNARRPW